MGAKDEMITYEKKYNKLYIIIDELNDEKENLKDDIEELLNENMQIKELLRSYIDQYDVIKLVHKKFQKMIEVLLLVLNKFDSLNIDSNAWKLDLKVIDEGNMKATERNNFQTEIGKMELFLKEVEALKKVVEDNQINKYKKIFYNHEYQLNTIDSIIKTNIFSNKLNNINGKASQCYAKSVNNKINKNKNYLESLEDKVNNLTISNNDLYLTKYELENFIYKLNPIIECKSKLNKEGKESGKNCDVDLSEAAKDLIELNKRVINLNKTIDRLQMQNDYFRLCLHNLTNPDNTSNLHNFINNQNLSNLITNTPPMNPSERLSKLKDNFDYLVSLNSDQKDGMKFKKMLDLMCSDISNMKTDLVQTINEKDILIDQLNRKLFIKIPLNNSNHNKEPCFNENIDKQHDKHSVKSEKLNQSRYFDENNNLSNDNILLNKYMENADSETLIKKLQKKLIKQEIELKYYKDRNKNGEDKGSTKVTEFGDLLMHIHNQAQIIENIIRV